MADRYTEIFSLYFQILTLSLLWTTVKFDEYDYMYFQKTHYSQYPLGLWGQKFFEKLGRKIVNLVRQN